MKPVRFTCPQCKAGLVIPAEQRRDILTCPDCGQNVRLGSWHLRRPDREERREEAARRQHERMLKESEDWHRQWEIRRQQAEQARREQEVRQRQAEQKRKEQERYELVRRNLVEGSSLTSARILNSSEMEILSTELYADVDRLQQLGIDLAKGALAAKVGGLGAAGYAAYQGHWLLGLAFGAAALVAKTVANEYKDIKLQETQQKWHRILLAMGDQNALLFADHLQQRHGLLAISLQRLFSPTD